MKRFLLVLFLFLFVVTCYAEDFAYVPLDVDVEQEAGVGDRFFTVELIVRNPPSRSKDESIITELRYELTIIELSKDKIGFQYSEYFSPSMGRWMIKEGFNKRLDFSLKDKVIYFKDYEFKILSFSKGKIKYKRTR